MRRSLGLPAARHRGFTLLEILLALALLALVISLVQGAYSGVARSNQISRERTEQTHSGAFMVHRIADELAMSFVDPGRPQATGLRLQTDSEGLSTVSFTSRMPPIYGFSRGGDAEIGYLVELQDDGARQLAARYASDLDGDLEGGGEPYVMLRDISRFSILCYDGSEWLEEWDSETRPAGEKPLPLSVAITVAWTEDEGNGDAEPVEHVFRTTTPVYASL